MSALQHFVSISGGKDSAAVACLAMERAARKAMLLRFVFADTGNEHPLTLEYVDYLARALGVTIETVRADFSGDFAERRDYIRQHWPNERRRLKHGTECNRRREAIPQLAPGCRHSPERAAALKAWVADCDCPEVVSPPVPAELIERAVLALHPTGNPFLDLCMLKGRFPGVKSRFCTDLLKLVPMEVLKDPLLAGGVSIVEWIGERAQESLARSKKPALERVRVESGASRFLFRPILQLKHPDVFAIARRHGLKPNPLYLQGMNRVGCMPCIMVKKDELREIARRFPDHIDRIAEWESIVRAVSRRQNATFLAAKVVPGDRGDETRAEIRRAVLWASTSKGGWNFDLENFLADEDALQCASAYGLCE